jgi:hypothetical protein
MDDHLPGSNRLHHRRLPAKVNPHTDGAAAISVKQEIRRFSGRMDKYDEPGARQTTSGNIAAGTVRCDGVTHDSSVPTFGIREFFFSPAAELEAKNIEL